MRTGFWKNWVRIRNKAKLPKECMFHDLHHTFAAYIASIEGERLDTDEVQSSIAKRLGIALSKDKPVGRDIEGIVEMMLDATQNYNQTLTVERLFDWHAALFPTGRSGMHRITVAAWRPAEAGSMQVVSGSIGHEKVHYEAPEASRLDAEMTKLLSWFESDLKLDPVLQL